MARSVILHFAEDVFDFVFVRPLLLDSWFGDFFWHLYKKSDGVRHVILLFGQQCSEEKRWGQACYFIIWTAMQWAAMGSSENAD